MYLGYNTNCVLFREANAITLVRSKQLSLSTIERRILPNRCLVSHSAAGRQFGQRRDIPTNYIRGSVDGTRHTKNKRHLHHQRSQLFSYSERMNKMFVCVLVLALAAMVSANGKSHTLK